MEVAGEVAEELGGGKGGKGGKGGGREVTEDVAEVAALWCLLR